jgi:putative spermidine/putrescine transport system permease protein
MRAQWREAAENLGATLAQYFRLIAVPVLLPPFLASTLLLFANAFSAYATAYALTTGIIPPVPIQIGSLVSGNVVADQQNLGKATRTASRRGESCSTNRACSRRSGRRCGSPPAPSR